MKQDIALKILCAGRNVFLTGSAGTGKTHVVNEYVKYLRERGIDPAIVAPTGIAASHIGGRTIHSFFAIGIENDVDKGYLRWLMRQPFLKKRLGNLKVLIVDEVSMVSPQLFFSMDKILRSFKRSEKPFGGIQVVLSGDFFQLPPIGKAPMAEKFVWQTSIWKECDLRVCYLEEKFRQEDDVLITILEEIRSGSVSEGSMEVFRSCYKKRLSNNFRPTKLYTHNVDVDRINQAELEKLPGEAAVFESNTKGSKNYIEKIFKSTLIARQIEIKKGAVVIFIKNNYEKGYINGTLGKVVSFSKEENLPIVEIFSGRRIIVDMEDWILEDDKGKIKANVEQVPLRLAWALTIHKSQGMTLDAAEIDLSKTFEIGQGYVALSRIKSIEGLRLLGLNEVALMVDELVLGVDAEMKKQSKLNRLKVKSIDKKELKEITTNFILENGGTVDNGEIEKNRKEISKENKDARKAFKQKKSKEGTVMVTKKMLLAKKTLAQISRERKITTRTIIGHLQKIKDADPNFDFNHVKPEEKRLKLILRAAQQVKKKNSQNDFCENGKMKLRPISEKLNKKFSYDEISLALLFGDF